MANILRMVRKTLKRGANVVRGVGKRSASVVRGVGTRSANVVRGVGKFTRKTVRRGTNTLGLTRKARHHKKSHKRSQ